MMKNHNLNPNQEKTCEIERLARKRKIQRRGRLALLFLWPLFAIAVLAGWDLMVIGERKDHSRQIRRRVA